MTAPESVRRQTLTGLAWTTLATVVQRVLQFAFTVVLARLIAPGEWGLFAIMSVFTGFASLFVDLGFASAIVQRPEIKDRHLNSAFWLNIGMGGVLTLLMIALAPAFAAFYSQPRLLVLTIGFAPAFFIGSLIGLQAALLRREMNFRRLAYIDNITFLSANVVATAMALLGFGVWSFVGLTITSGIVRSGILWRTSSWRPTAGPDRQSFRELWGFSGSLTAFNALNYWQSNADNLLIGRFIGITPLAFYNRAYSLTLIPVDAVNIVTNRVMYPTLSRIQEDRERVKKIYLNALGMIALFVTPAIVGLGVLSRSFIMTVYGHRWEHVIPFVQILCVASFVQTFAITTEWIFNSQGRADWLFRWGIFSSTTVIASFLIGLPWGVKGIAIAYAAWSALSMAPLFAIVGKLINLSVLEVLGRFSGVALASALMGVGVWLFEGRLPSRVGNGGDLAAGVAAGVVIYTVATHLVSPEPYREFRGLLAEFARRRRLAQPTDTAAPY